VLDPWPKVVHHCLPISGPQLKLQNPLKTGSKSVRIDSKVSRNRGLKTSNHLGLLPLLYALAYNLHLRPIPRYESRSIQRRRQRDSIASSLSRRSRIDHDDILHLYIHFNYKRLQLLQVLIMSSPILIASRTKLDRNLRLFLPNPYDQHLASPACIHIQPIPVRRSERPGIS
jgi:hypothetical protein